jgi:competence protein ComEC
VPWASLELPQISGMVWLTILLPVLWAVLPPRWPGRSLAWIGLFGLAMHSPKPPEQDCAQISILDVGQGLAAVIRSHREIVLYDTGPAYRGGGSAMQSIVLPYLQSRGVRRVDHLIVSHGDLDHAGGVEALMAELPIGQVLSGAELSSVASQPCRTGINWHDSGVQFSILHPTGESELSGNDGSCVLLVEVGAFRTLLTGDIETAAEQLLLQSGTLPKVHVVTMPHHGSQTSSTSAFIRALSASYAIATAGYGNRWGFPKEQVVARWQSADVTVINTATAGAVELEVCADSGFTSITGYRVVKRRIWHE